MPDVHDAQDSRGLLQTGRDLQHNQKPPELLQEKSENPDRKRTARNAKRAAQREMGVIQSSARSVRMIVWKSKPGYAIDATRRRRRKLQSSWRCSTQIWE